MQPKSAEAEFPIPPAGVLPEAGSADAALIRAPGAAPVTSEPVEFAPQVLTAATVLIATVFAWLVPGLGHALLRRWQRALAFFVAVSGLALSGYWMRGNVFSVHSQDPFGTLGFLADAGSGIFYLLSHIFEASGPNVARAVGDYGTRFIAAAGIVNVLAVCDAYEIANGRRR